MLDVALTAYWETVVIILALHNALEILAYISLRRPNSSGSSARHRNDIGNRNYQLKRWPDPALLRSHLLKPSPCRRTAMEIIERANHVASARTKEQYQCTYTLPWTAIKATISTIRNKIK